MDMSAAFGGATTVQDRFLVMLNERVGNLEAGVHELRSMLADLGDAMTTIAVRTYLEVPHAAYPAIDPAFLKKLVDAVQKTRCVVVDTAWIISPATWPTDPGPHNLSIYLRLKARVVAAKVSDEMNEHLAAEFGLVSAYCHDWEPASIPCINRNLRSRKTASVFRMEVDAGECVQVAADVG
jgi:hypothetical protein